MIQEVQETEKFQLYSDKSIPSCSEFTKSTGKEKDRMNSL